MKSSNVMALDSEHSTTICRISSWYSDKAGVKIRKYVFPPKRWVPLGDRQMFPQQNTGHNNQKRKSDILDFTKSRNFSLSIYLDIYIDI